MIDITTEIEIDRPVDVVFAYVTDPERLPTWQTNTVSVTREGDGPLRVGDRLHEVHRGPGGRDLASVVEVDELEPDAVFGLRMVEGALPIHARLTFAAAGDHTRLAFRSYGEPRGAMRLLQPILRHQLRRQFAQHCATLKRVLERESNDV